MHTIYIHGGPNKILRIDLEEKCLRNFKTFFEGIFIYPYYYSYLLKKLEHFKLCRKKSYGALKIMKIARSKKSPYPKVIYKLFFLSISIAR